MYKSGHCRLNSPGRSPKSLFREVLVDSQRIKPQGGIVDKTLGLNNQLTRIINLIHATDLYIVSVVGMRRKSVSVPSGVSAIVEVPR